MKNKPSPVPGDGLDFTLSSQEDRAAHVRSLSSLPCDAETAASYILWGTEEDLSLAERSRLYGLRTSTARNPTIVSLDDLLADGLQPAFRPLSRAKTVVRRQRIDRATVRREADPIVLSNFESLWRSIDTLLVRIAVCEGVPIPQTELSPAEVEALAAEPISWTPYQLSLARKRLISMRTQQYALRSSFIDHHQRHFPEGPIPENDNWDLPLNTSPFPVAETPPSLWRFPLQPAPKAEHAALRALARHLHKADTSSALSFTNVDHLAHLFSYVAAGNPLPEPIQAALHFYFELAHLSPLLLDVCAHRAAGLSNPEVAALINAKFQTTYSPNYVSILFKTQALTKVAAAAAVHPQIFECLDDPSSWRACTKCGAALPLIPYFWTRRKDGFVHTCKHCEALKRKKEA